MRYLLCYLLLGLLYQFVHNERCYKVTFIDTQIKVARLGTTNINERFTATIAGIIEPEIITQQLGGMVITRIECYNQSVPILYECAISNMTELQSLVISHSKVKRIKKRAFNNLVKLSSLTVSNNEIESIDNGVFDKVNSLQVLDLTNNKIAFLESGIFSSLPKLFRIELANNNLEVFEAEWFPEDSILTEIFMQGNAIRSIHKNAFKPFRLLRNLNLGTNRIQFIHKDAFDSLRHLSFLYLNDNRIRKLHKDTFKNNKEVSGIWIDGNNLTYISDEMLKGLTSPELFQMSIHTNPWQCACYNQIMKWAAQRKVFIINGVECFNDNSPVCLYPKRNEDLCLEEIEEDLNQLFYEVYDANHSCMV